ncbi:MAG TPA: M23 family metallopeptidase [Gaiellaceae bacterium]|nr:M23 family metallopeptidase [Gaiellaceae bacterium]
MAVSIVGPDGTVLVSTGETRAPAPNPAPAAFSYPDDGSTISSAAISVTTSASADEGTAASSVELSGLSLLGGEITADRVRAAVQSAATVGDLAASELTNLVVLGQPVPEAAPDTKLPLADWGTLTLLGQTTRQRGGATPAWEGVITALVVHLDADHAGLAAGTELRIGFAQAFSREPAPAQTPAPPVQTPKPLPTPKTRAHVTLPRGVGQQPARPVQTPKPTVVPSTKPKVTTAKKPKQPKKPRRKGLLPVHAPPPDVTPKLTAGGYVFPVYGPSGYGDSFAAPRGDVSGGWHHGDDIFAPLGAPILAIAEGTVFSVGWNDIGGYRLWLRDRAGNEFYYAHLSAYTKLAVNGRHVHAGDVLGFVGSTGDAEGTPFHLHFEVHPVSLLFLGYDGAVNPTTYLNAWERLEDVRILAAVPFLGPAARPSNAPTPGAILLESSDISTANGLEPETLQRAMNRPPKIDLSGPSVAQLPVPLPVLDRA